MKDKIKKLAKESLEDKWYPLKRGDKGVHISDSCAFCKEFGDCRNCYIEKTIPGFCFNIPKENIDNVINFLEHLVKFGGVKE